MYLLGVPPQGVVEEVESYQQLREQVPQGGGMCNQQMTHNAHTYHLKYKKYMITRILWLIFFGLAKRPYIFF